MTLLDATYGKNDRLMPLQSFIGATSENIIIPFAIGSTRSEVKEDYLWLLECFYDSYGCLSPTWITDGDAKIYDSISEIAARNGVVVSLLLCTWHLLQNIKRHLGQTSLSFDPIELRVFYFFYFIFILYFIIFILFNSECVLPCASRLH